VEVSADEITLRAGSQWLRFTHSSLQHSDGDAVPFALMDDGKVRMADGAEQEMDFAAEWFARELLQGAN
jgi:hypothetical protein